MNNDGNDLLNLDTAGSETTTNNSGNDGTGGNDTNLPAGGNADKGSNDQGSGQDITTNWKSYIPEDLKDRSEWNNIKDFSGLCKNYINSQQMISKSVRLPDATSTPEDVAAFYAKLGKPQNKEDYTFEYTPAKKEYEAYNKDSFDFTVFQEIAEKANLTKDQYQKLASAYVDINNENYLSYTKHIEQSAAQELKEAEQKLKADWGTNYNTNINSISDKIQKLYPKDTLRRMQNAGLFRDAAFLTSQLKLTKMMTGDTVFIEGNAVENVPQTLQTLQAQRDKLMNEDYLKNRDQVLALNQQIVKLKQSQQTGAAKFHG